MWLVTLDGFISIVQDRDDARLLQVRARDSQDIRAHFPRAKVCVIEGADYRYRARVNRQTVARVIAKTVRDIDYDSHFKDVAIATSPPNPARSRAYYGTWDALAEMQDVPPYGYQRYQTGGWYE